MTIELSGIAANSFKLLEDKYGFGRRNELSDGDTYSIEYTSKNFAVRLEKYRTELYATLHKTGSPEKQIGLFNLLAYLMRTHDPPVAEYYHDEAGIEERFRKQLDYVASVVDENFQKIDAFFGTSDLTSKFVDVQEFMVKRHPELFARRMGE